MQKVYTRTFIYYIISRNSILHSIMDYRYKKNLVMFFQIFFITIIPFFQKKAPYYTGLFALALYRILHYQPRNILT